MQLMPAGRPASVRGRLAAACVLLAVGAPRAEAADPAAAPRRMQLDATALFYRERDRVTVMEPVARITRVFENGQTLSAQFALDGVSGASPTGALPAGAAAVQTTTAASGGAGGAGSGRVPMNHFRDLRSAADMSWQVPLGAGIVPSLEGHASREQDYRSLGVGGQLAIDLMQRLTTLTVGAEADDDEVLPVGGTRVPLDSTGALLARARQPKRVVSTMLGLSRVLTRRWLVGANFTRTLERGYLTEPYKVVSVTDPASGLPVGHVSEKRPGSRDRRALLASSVYHFADDVLYSSYRFYADDWGVRSHTLEAQYRRELGGERFVQPLLRLYTQRAADFFRFGVPRGRPLPRHLTADERLGPLSSVTLGATCGFRIGRHPGEFVVRGEYTGWWVRGSPIAAVNARDERESDEREGESDDARPPTLDAGSVVVGYSVRF